MPDDISSQSMGGQRCRGCTPKEAARWLRTADEGRLWARQREGTMSMAQMVHEAVEASRIAAAAANAAAERDEAPDKRKRKREAPPMSSTATILKNARALGEHGMTKLITDYAKQRFPELTAAQAFVKCFTEDSDEGKALRTIHAISKGVVDADGPEREYGFGRGRGVAGGALDPDEVEDEAEGEQDDAMDELNELAEQERKRDPSLSKAAAFTKVFCDPANVALAKRERTASMRKIGVAVRL
jgi:hypothetical protein